jgi:hypothetical protein
MTSTPNPSADEKDICQLIERAYDALEFEPDSNPDWDEFAAVFEERCVLALRVFPQDEHIRVLSLQEYMKAQMENDLGDQGYSETPGERSVYMCGDVARVEQMFTMNFALQDPVLAIDIFSLIRNNKTWKIVSVVSDMASQ